MCLNQLSDKPVKSMENSVVDTKHPTCLGRVWRYMQGMDECMNELLWSMFINSI